VLYPKSEKMATIAVKASAKVYLPKMTLPKLRAMTVDNTSPNNEMTNWRANNAVVFFASRFVGWCPFNSSKKG
jgi:hypothetical protein